MYTMSQPSQLDANTALVTKFMQDVWNRQDAAAVPNFVTTDYIDHAYTPRDASGHAAMVGAFSAAFSDAQHVIEQLTAQDDYVVIRVRVTARHTGNFRDAAPSGNLIDVVQYRTFRLLDNKIAEHWALFDTATLFRQIGASPSPANACVKK
ncbi:ester cyclase [Solimicrobium silvestre]|uniref:Putative ester cyclase n=1 Tax=Solimicrobium silvestre TaxID=2099400 RepID=A0A2S9GWC7_9BURK|nr:ester cyclase [Solimicrobium silvestre]PRC91998.1 putative ester cyclase [Solimicrobium silvestre]